VREAREERERALKNFVISCKAMGAAGDEERVPQMESGIP
jgi:hypothetical protein